ncbi:23S rRNA (adenine(2503)-C(2))-methyltransferase RlmN [Silvanigrella aquatica]|uniref:23S rRNA (Adenine(2503)-C(2))-methyltransferase n=1 Tax=Silvanigrella aquatica TaxID=1915309 RepID=A0A1L4D0Y4_9BACT|nr:23S rRNA (adenine(2503)-C(2))-methyltransferase RlmN [Silvanigrella aquatica]APJ03840.1 23S rRNA (adenine(2503)-C(2))-methyltransferase [Silvanigrella aquatica]
MKSFYGQNRTVLTHDIANHFGTPKSQFRADLLYRNIYKYQALEPSHFEGLSEDVKKWFFNAYYLDIPLEIEDLQLSTHDGSVKFAMRLKSDGRLVESVLIPERGRLTQCISTQVGCAQACRFCQTGRMGLMRSLTTEEIIGQVLLAERWRRENPTASVSGYKNITNIVYMGMGEPLDNIDNVINSTNIFCDNLGLNFSPNKVTISTVGLLPALNTILEKTSVAIALSLHSPFEAERSKIMPVNVKNPITEVIEVIKNHSKKRTNRSFMVQYTLLRGINDTKEHAHALVTLLKEVPAKINLIPLNEHEGASFRRPDLGRVYAFQQELKQAGMVATVRLSKGRDIQAACGQLIQDKVSK